MSTHRYQDIRFKPESLERIEQINEIIDEYVAQGFRLTVRKLYYQLVARGIIENTERSYKNTTGIVNDGKMAGLIAWKPSIFMPRAACRLVLEVTAVRVERLQEISGLNAEAEGVRLTAGAALWPHVNRSDKMKTAYRALWDSLNAKRGFGWDVNPLVWVIEFKRTT